jgi:hypothetical protein
MISQLTCQHCSQTFEAEIVDKTEFCPHCGKETSVNTPDAAVTSYEKHATTPSVPVASEAASLRARAEFLNGMGIFFAVLAGLSVLVGIVSSIDVSGERAARALNYSLTIGVSFAAAAAWFAFMSQIVHIRANTLK